MIRLEPFRPPDFDLFISWIDSREILLQIAGAYFSYPLTSDQLQNYLDDKKSLAFKVIEESSEQVIGHAEIILQGPGICKLDKVIIGDKEKRGMGIGQQLISKLLEYCFFLFHADVVELLVYDWNVSAIKSYEKAGFSIAENNAMQMEVGGVVWKVLKMKIEKAK
jgi:RimJ/RimL family protein N-acetyltransferase